MIATVRRWMVDTIDSILMKCMPLLCHFQYVSFHLKLS